MILHLIMTKMVPFSKLLCCAFLENLQGHIQFDVNNAYTEVCVPQLNTIYLGQ